MADSVDALLAAIAERNASGWPKVYMPKGYPNRGDYLPASLEPGHVYRDASGTIPVRLAIAGDRLSFWLPGVGGTLVNPKSKGIPALGLITTYGHYVATRGDDLTAAAYRSANLLKGQPVLLMRQADHPTIRNAVALSAPHARQPFGYIQPGKAASIARRIDVGEVLAGISMWGQGPGKDDDTAHIVIGSVADLMQLIGD